MESNGKLNNEVSVRLLRKFYDDNIECIKSQAKDQHFFREGEAMAFRPVLESKAVAVLNMKNISGYSTIVCPAKVNISDAQGVFESGDYDVVAVIVTEDAWSSPYILDLPDSVEEIYFTNQTHRSTYFQTKGNGHFISRDGDLFSTDGREWYHHYQQISRDGQYSGPEIPEDVEVLKTGVLNFYYFWDKLVVPTSVKAIESHALSDARIEVIDLQDNIPELIDESAFTDGSNWKIKKIRVNLLYNKLLESNFLERISSRFWPSKFHSLICKAPDLHMETEYAPGEIHLTETKTDSVKKFNVSEILLDSLSTCQLEVYDGVLSGTTFQTGTDIDHCNTDHYHTVYESIDVVRQRIALATNSISE